MKHIKLRKRILSMGIALVALAGTGPAHAYSVYRKVTADAVTGVVVWTAANFGVSGAPPTLSFFYYADDAAALVAMPDAQCFVKVDLPGVDNPQPNDESTVGNAAFPSMVLQPISRAPSHGRSCSIIIRRVTGALQDRK